MTADAPASEAAQREATRRLFFALWPDEPMQAAMLLSSHRAVQAIRASRGSGPFWGGRPVPAGNLHVTLAFLGSVPRRQMQELGETGREVAGSLSSELAAAGCPRKPLEIIFDHLEHWRAAQVLCASPAEPVALLATLAKKLKDLLVGRGFVPDLKPFRPHVTVVRKVAPRAQMARTINMHPVVWRFTEIALIESRTLPEGALYSVVQAFTLFKGKYAANNSETP